MWSRRSSLTVTRWVSVSRLPTMSLILEGFLARCLEILARHGALEAARQDAFGWAGKARKALERVPDHPMTEMLADLSDYVVERIN